MYEKSQTLKGLNSLTLTQSIIRNIILSFFKSVIRIIYFSFLKAKKKELPKGDSSNFFQRGYIMDLESTLLGSSVL